MKSKFSIRLRKIALRGEYVNVKHNGEEQEETFEAASNHAISLIDLQRFEEARTLMRKTTRVARRLLGESHEDTLRMRWIYAETLHFDDGATVDDLREAVTTLEDAAQIARRVFGGEHPLTAGIEGHLQNARKVLRARSASLE